MIASQLVSIAQDLQQEYKRFGLLGLLQDAFRVSSERPNLNSSQYRAEADALHAKAQAILTHNVFRTYPLDTLKILSNSELSSILPATIARMIIAGFPKRKESAISSAELNMYASEANAVLSQIDGFLTFSNRLGVTAYEPPEQTVALSIKLPRRVFSNELGELEKHLSHFSSLFRSVTELVSGSRENPKLVYLATSDPTVSVAMLGSAALAILIFYKTLLEVAEKQIGLLKTLRDLKSSSIPIENMENIEQGIHAGLQSTGTQAVDSAFDKIQIHVTPERAKELRVEIGRMSTQIVADLAGGARIFVSLESQQQIDLLADETPDDSNDIRNTIEEQKQIETRLDVLAADLFERKPELLTTNASAAAQP